MPITRKSIYAPQPSTQRARPTHLSTDPQGERLAYASGKSVFLRSIDDPSLSTQYTGHTSTVNVARFSPSGYYVASGDSSGMVRVWDAVGPEMITKGEFGIISGPINDIAWDGESKRLIAVGNGKERFGHCITFDTGNSVGEILGHSSTINSVSIRQSRPYRAATASDDKSVVFFHGAPFKYNKTLTGHHSNFLQGVAFSPDGEHFVSVGTDRKIILYDGKTGEFKTEIAYGDAAHRGGIYSVSWSKDSTRFVTASADQTVKVWDLRSEKNSHTWRSGPEGTSIADHQVGVVWTPRADNTIISLSLSGDLNYLDLNSDRPRRVITGHQTSITAMKITGETKTLFTGGVDGKTCGWDLAKGSADSLDGGHTNSVCGFSSQDERRLASIGQDDFIRLIDVGAKVFIGTNHHCDAQPKGFTWLTLKGEQFLVTVTEKGILLGKVTTKLKVNDVLEQSYTPTHISGCQDKGIFAVSATDQTVHIYSIYEEAPGEQGIKEEKVLRDARAAPTCLSYSPSGKYFAVGFSSGKIILYNVEEDYAVKTTRWSFHTARVASITWNAEETHVVSGSLDTNIYIYSVAAPGKNQSIKNAHMGGVTAVDWEGSDGIISGGADGTIKRWEVKLE
ncbi:WD40 repeat-like protein [Choiromyces venosus 120613-1]|uniref:WD40 repeat-like protein n=1 Tax=Choiromyces venosus 120613-1 TaxID=1336337 RepID=A0A3N4JRP5_9PEZI|nr:WD40 repeat-like protein [Choiromyces venosus 120613-1]